MRRPSPATAIAFLALCVALSGIAYAQSIEADSIGPRELKEPSVGTSQVSDRSLRRIDFARGQVPRGPRGPRGRRGLPGATRVVARHATGRDIPGGDMRSMRVHCRPGERATGGGGGFAGIALENDRIVESLPGTGTPPRDWRVTIFNGGRTPRSPVAYVVCARP
ncbi:MAG TPA: hypothetical protein VGW75_02280 [Solirubrobacteraceae bacterium]|jgi:hypothetical protein|nr:hypothetical protein [Solirubrobacteraceae bacterium]